MMDDGVFLENIQCAVHDSMHNAWDQIKGIKEDIGEMDRSKGILAKIERSMEFCKNLISGMKQNLLRARAHLVHFQLSVRQNEEERVPSTQEIMHELSASANIEFAKPKRTQEVRA